MTPIGDTRFDARTQAANAAWRMRALEKPRSTSDLHGEWNQEAQQQPHQAHSENTFSAPQNGTQPHVPFRHAPRLTAAFTAQLLGQIMPDPERRPVSGYAQTPRLLSLGFDSRF